MVARIDVHVDVLVDVLVIGAGVVGAAVARELAAARRTVLVVDAAKQEGTGLTSRSSGVVHSGLYYPPGSLKARTCVRGQALLYSFAANHDVAFRRTGKLVVARSDEDAAELERLLASAREAGAAGVRLATAREALNLEPHLGAAPAAALWCPETGIVDAHGLCRALRLDAESVGATFAFSSRLLSAGRGATAFEIESTRGPVKAGAVVNAAGLQADEVATLFGLDGPKHHPCRGDWWRFRTRTRYSRLVYPVRRGGDPGLGVHLTLDLAGRARLGPDAVWVKDRDDLRPDESRRAFFHEEGVRLLGDFPEDALTWDGAGVRPKLSGPGEPPADFAIVEGPPGAFHLLGIESPGLTAALALAEVVRDRVLGNAGGLGR